MNWLLYGKDFCRERVEIVCTARETVGENVFELLLHLYSMTAMVSSEN